MGCDIHTHIEVKIRGVWQHLAAPSIGRNYNLFEKMAGVRGEDENAIAVPKGVPEDITLLTRLDLEYWGEDAHSVSWFGPDEIDTLTAWYEKQRNLISFEHDVIHTYLFGNGLTAFMKYPEDCEWAGIEDVRLVFWFDN